MSVFGIIEAIKNYIVVNFCGNFCVTQIAKNESIKRVFFQSNGREPTSTPSDANWVQPPIFVSVFLFFLWCGKPMKLFFILGLWR